MKKQMVGGMSEWAGMFKELFRQVGDGSLTKAQLQAMLEHRNPFTITDIESEWLEFYRKYFRLSVDFSDVAIPDDPGGFERVIFVPKGLKFTQAIKALREKFEVYLYTEDLDREVAGNVRTTDESYAILVHARVEADEELKSISANQLKDQRVNSITLLERLVFELKYYSETDQHLDIQSWTLCAGSRGSGGSVPFVGWLPGDCELHVSWYGLGNASDVLRARQAVS
jgi:hypothetical protein